MVARGIPPDTSPANAAPPALRPSPYSVFKVRSAHCNRAAPIPQGANGIAGYQTDISNANGSGLDGSAPSVVGISTSGRQLV